MKTIIITAILCVFMSSTATAQENFCHDPKSWDDWNKIVKKYPDDIELQISHALRIGMCVKVEEGSISFEDAVDVTNSWSEAMIQERAEQAKKEKGEKL